MLGGKRRCAEGMTVTDPRMELLVPAWGAHRKHSFVSHSPEAGSSRSDVVPAEGLLAGLQMATFSLRPHVVETDRQSSLVSLLTRTLILVDQGPTLMTSFNLNPVSKCSPTGGWGSNRWTWGT